MLTLDLLKYLIEIYKVIKKEYFKMFPKIPHMVAAGWKWVGREVESSKKLTGGGGKKALKMGKYVISPQKVLNKEYFTKGTLKCGNYKR